MSHVRWISRSSSSCTRGPKCLCTNATLKTESCYYVTCHQWRQSWNHNDYWFLMVRARYGMYLQLSLWSTVVKSMGYDENLNLKILVCSRLGNPPVSTSVFRSHQASDAGNVSMSWRHLILVASQSVFSYYNSQYHANQYLYAFVALLRPIHSRAP